jgi:hypothetical protein
MTHDQSRRMQRSGYLAADCAEGLPANSKGALVTVSEKQRMSAWLRARGVCELTPFSRRRKAA